MRKFIDFVNNNKFFCCYILAIVTLLFLLRMNMYERQFIKRKDHYGVCLHVVNKLTNKHYFQQTFYKGQYDEFLDGGGELYLGSPNKSNY